MISANFFFSDKLKILNKITKTVAIITVTLLLSQVLTQAALASSLNLELSTNSQTYSVGTKIVVNANLTLDGNPVLGRLVSIQVNDPQNKLFVMRTVPTATNLTDDWAVEILNITTVGNIYGTPQYTFARGSAAGVKVTVRNNLASSSAIAIIVNMYDALGVPFTAFTLDNSTIGGGETKPVFMYPAVQIPKDAQLGTGIIYATILNAKLPQESGFALAPEAATTFTIISGGSSSTSDSPTASQSYFASMGGTTNVTFRTPLVNARLGNYTAYATSFYRVGVSTYFASDSLLFQVVLIGDLNKDGKVDIRDIAIVAKAYGSSAGPPPSPTWNPAADLYKDGKIDIRDIAIVAKNFGTSGSY